MNGNVRSDSATKSGSGRNRSLLAIALYTLLSLILTFPLVSHLTTHVPGDGIDDPSLAWNLWWIKARLVDQLNLDIFHADWTFFPIQINLAFYTLTPLNGLLSIPLQSATTLVIASNLILLSSFVLSGLGAYLLARQELRWLLGGNISPGDTHLPALFAGLVYGFASSKLFYASLGQFNIASSQWIPFCVLFLLRIGRSAQREKQLRSALLAGIFFLFQAWAELTYASFLLIFIALWLLWQLVTKLRARQFLRLRSLFVPLLLFGAIAGIGLAPFLAAMLPDLRAEGDFFGSGGGFADIFSADLFGYLLPTRLHPLLGSWVADLPFPNNKGQQIFLGYSVMICWMILAGMILAGMALTGRVFYQSARNRPQRNAIYFWLLNAIFFFLLTLGPHLRWRGSDLPIPGPFALVSQLPFFSGNRYPSRYGVMLVLCMAMLAALGIARLQRKRAFTSLFALLFLAEQLAIPLPINDFRIPPIYQRIAQTPGDFTVLELPTGWRNGAREIGRRDVIFMMQQWYQTAHGKRRLGGNTSRNPPYKFQYFSEAPLIDDLIALMNADQWYMSGEVDGQWQRMVDAARQNAARILSFLDVRYLVVHVERSTPQLLRFVDEALPVKRVDSWQGNDWMGNPSTIELYEVTASAPFSEVDLRDAAGKLYQAEGWSALVGTGAVVRPTANLLLDLPEAGGTLSIELASATGLAELWLNGKWLAALAQTADYSTQRIQVPAGLADQPVDHLQLRFRTVGNEPPPPLAAEEWQMAGNRYAVPIAVRSAGLEVGAFAEIFVAGKQVAGKEMVGNQRGYNLVAISAEGEVLDSVVFDTFGNCGSEPPDESASQALAEWLTQWQPQTIIAGAAVDEASCRLGEVAVAALRTIGVNGDLRGRFRSSHAFIGVVGAQPGEAQEAMTLLQPAAVRVGNGIDGERVYARVGKVGFEE